MAKFIKKAIIGEALKIYGDGQQTRDFIYIDDLIRAILLSTSREGIGGEVFQIATNSETTVLKLVETLIPILNNAGIMDVKVIHGNTRKGDVYRNFSDTSKAKHLLNWQSKISIHKGLALTTEWFTKECK